MPFLLSARVELESPLIRSSAPEIPFEVRVTPAGNEPISVNVGAGWPCAVRSQDPSDPWVNEALGADVIDGGIPGITALETSEGAPSPLMFSAIT